MLYVYYKFGFSIHLAFEYFSRILYLNGLIWVVYVDNVDITYNKSQNQLQVFQTVVKKSFNHWPVSD